MDSHAWIAMKTAHLYFFTCLIFLAASASLVSSCQVNDLPPQNIISKQTLTINPTATVPPPASPTPADEVSSKQSLLAAPAQISTKAPSNRLAPGIYESDLPQPTSIPPLRFNIPTPGPAPKSLWRPPLYDPPFALSPYDHFYFNRPIAADEVNWPIPDYRYGGVFFSSDIVHTGIDIPVKNGTPVLAAASGTVIWAGYGLMRGSNDPSDPYGLAVTIRHDFSFKGKDLFTVYAHLQKIDVTIGQRVETGYTIGAVGTTGLTTGPHLHFEVRTDVSSYFTTLNPELWLSPPQGWGILVGRVMNASGGFLSSYPVEVRNKKTNQKWTVYSYGKQAVNSDPYYHENLVLSDLPAGLYEIKIEYKEDPAKQDINIYPGTVSYFTFWGERYFRLDPPTNPGLKDLLQLPSLKAHP
jgi:murein DD-endopeptidase MepM/ murein hydrolase activator NlpD